MFAKWLRKRATKRIQAECPHEWIVVNEYSRGERSKVDIYCGPCDSIRMGVCKFEARTLIKVQEVRKQYEEGGR